MEKPKELTGEIRETIEKVLYRFLPEAEPVSVEPFLVSDQPGYRKFIAGVETSGGRRIVVKLVHEDAELLAERDKIERQSAYSEELRKNGILTPKRFTVDGRYCVLAETSGGMLCATAEEYCGSEIREISVPLAEKIGALLGRIHLISQERGLSVGCGTLFGAAVNNDVNVFERFCVLSQDPRLDRDAVSCIKTAYLEKMGKIRDRWDELPRAATQGDISINNLVDAGDSLIVFDYNNAGDEVLVSDMVLEGLLTAYEMDLSENTPPEIPQRLFQAFWEGYRQIRPLTKAEQEAAWDIYALYDSLWFTKIVYNEDSLEKLLKTGDVFGANRRLSEILAGLRRENDGRFGR